MRIDAPITDNPRLLLGEVVDEAELAGTARDIASWPRALDLDAHATTKKTLRRTERRTERARCTDEPTIVSSTGPASRSVEAVVVGL